MIHFVGRLASEGHVRTELIVPFQKPGESSAKVLPALWNQNASSAFVFRRVMLMLLSIRQLTAFTC